MERLYITPVDKQHWLSMRTEAITSTDVGALFGLSPYLTKFELWHNKKSGIITEIEETERMGWGNKLERAIGESIIEEQLWVGKQMKDYVVLTNLKPGLPDYRMGTSFDFFITVDEIPAILEIKNVDQFAFQRGWIGEGDNTEAPAHIELQVQYQMLVSGRKLAYIGALIGGNHLVLIKREADEAIHTRIIEEVAAFWKTIEDNEAPVPDFAKDAAFIQSLYKYAEPGKIIDADDRIITIAETYKKTSDMIKELEIEKDKQKAMILELIQDAEKVKGEMFTISAGVVGETNISYTRKSYRNFRITWRGEKT